MKRFIYSVRDDLSEYFSRTIDEINDATAIRAFVSSFQDNPNRNDFALYCIGHWNDSDGNIIPLPPKRIFSGLDIKDAEVVNLPTSLKEQAE